MGTLGSLTPTPPSEHPWSQDRSSLGSFSPRGLIHRPTRSACEDLVPILTELPAPAGTTFHLPRQGSAPRGQKNE